MRLTCPKCGATYQLGGEAVPQGGSHVQCGACHTRWFVRPERPAPAALSEEQIVERLESRTARQAGAQPAPAQTAARSGDEDDASAPILFPGPARPAPVAPAAALAPAEPPEPKVPERSAAPAAPGPALSPAAAATPLRPRPPAAHPAPAPAAASPSAEPERPAAGGGRAVLGALTAAALAALALGVYLRADTLAAQAPRLAPTISAYAAAVDDGRAWIEARLGPLRDRLRGG